MGSDFQILLAISTQANPSARHGSTNPMRIQAQGQGTPSHIDLLPLPRLFIGFRWADGYVPINFPQNSLATSARPKVERFLGCPRRKRPSAIKTPRRRCNDLTTNNKSPRANKQQTNNSALRYLLAPNISS
jgi:hypothetical protein